MATSGSFRRAGHSRWAAAVKGWRIAYASAKEADSHLRLLAHARVVDAAGAVDVLEIFDEVRAMTWRLLNPKTS